MNRSRFVLVAAAAVAIVVGGCASLPPVDSSAPPVIVHVSPDQPWMDTGVHVHKGELLYITAQGEVFWGSRNVTASADGIKGQPKFVEDGGLVGRVSSQPEHIVAIGARTHDFPNPNVRSTTRVPPPPLKMPADGTLWLGFKKFMPGQNTGGFDITIRRAEGRS